jgi:hypothetical protein
MMGPIADKMLNHYHTEHTIKSPFPGQDTEATFDFDFRNTRSPFIGEGYMDMYILGELTYENNTCTLEPDYMDFIHSDTFSQLVISESAASCLSTRSQCLQLVNLI